MADASHGAGDLALARSHPSTEIRRQAFGLVVMLVAQFFLGMLVNLFVKVPDQHPGAKPDEYFSGSFQSVVWAISGSGVPALVLHAILGLLLVLAGGRLVVEVRRLHRRGPFVAAILGLLFVVAAGFNGASFLDFGLDVSSMIMATFFALAMLAYVFVLYAVA